MDFIKELKSRMDLLKDPENLRAVDGAGLSVIGKRLMQDGGFQEELDATQAKRYQAYSACANRT
jgi:hypothetical protein